MPWTTLREPMLPWGKTVDKIVASVRPPTLAGETLIVATDSGGTDSTSRYRTDVFLCFDAQFSTRWELARRDVRARFLADGRRMSYKRLGDAVRAKALIPFLSAALEIHGLLVATIINRKLRILGVGHAHHSDLKRAASLHARWKDGELDTAARMTHMIACLVAGLSHRDQNVYWISDEDNLLGNSAQRQDVSSLLSRFTSYYVRHPMGELGVGTSSLDEGDRWEEDITAVPDLVAGGLAEITNRLAEACGGRLPTNLAFEHNDPFLAKADLIARWFWTAPGHLTRVAIVFEELPDGQYVVFKQDMFDQDR